MLIQGDAALIPFPDKTFHCAVFSPPYWGLRKYAGEQGRIWGGCEACKHEFVERKYYTMRGASSQSSEAFSEAGQTNADRLKAARWMTDSICNKCGAWYGALGLEPTPELHIEHMVEIFQEIRRVLRDDGVVYLNYGDCYAGGGRGGGREEAKQRTNKGSLMLERGYQGIPQGNLMMMPHKVAIALQNDGWIVRNDVVWWKRNPMPESVNGWRFESKSCDCTTERREALIANMPDGVPRHRAANIKPGDVKAFPDCPKCHGTGKVGDPVLRKGSWRHTRAHEYIFQLVKGPKMNYYSNQEAVREPAAQSTLDRMGLMIGGGHGDASRNDGDIGSRLRFDDFASGRNPRSVLKDERQWAGSYEEQGSIVAEDWKSNPSKKVGKSTRRYSPLGGANPRSVLDVPIDSMEMFYYWLGDRMGIDLYEAMEAFRLELTNLNDVLDVPTAPYKGAHYATFPPNLIAPLIRASCPKRCCPECGAPWAPVVERSTAIPQRENWKQQDDPQRNDTERAGGFYPPSTVLDYRPTCECDCGDHIPGIVLDPFIGSGTTGAVARELGRRWVGLDISMEYLDQQAKIRALKWTPSGALDDLPLFRESE